MMSRLSALGRTKAVVYWKQGQSIRSIASKLSVNRKTISKWVHRHESTGSIESIRPRGRPPALSEQARKRALELMLDPSSGGARNVAKKLVSENLTGKLVAPNTIIRGIRDEAKACGDKVKCLRGRPKKGLTQQNRLKRMAFARANEKTDWDRVMFTDRCKFLFRYPGTAVYPTRWKLKSQADEDACYRPNRPMAFNVYAGITKYGVTKLIPVTGTSNQRFEFKNVKNQPSRNITKAEYERVSGELLREGNRIFWQRAGGPWVFQQDGDPTHGAIKHALRTYNVCGGGYGVKVLENWPGNSPDLSPIENVWAWVDREVAQKGCKTFEEFKAEICKAFSSIPESMLENLFKSVPDRLQKVLSCKGAKIRY